jgi:hypothetical protein
MDSISSRSANCSKTSAWEEAARLFERGLQCRDNGIRFRRGGEASVHPAEEARRFEEASVCGKGRRGGHIYAHIEIAKYYEHKRRDVKSALHGRGLPCEHLERPELPAYVRKHWLEEISHRLARLERKDGI